MPDEHPVQRASESDRRFFDRNPGDLVRLRPYIEGEFLHEPRPEEQWVLVQQVEPGFRLRRPFILVLNGEAVAS